MLVLSYAWQGIVTKDLNVEEDGPLSILLFHVTCYWLLGLILMFLQIGLVQESSNPIIPYKAAMNLLTRLLAGVAAGVALMLFAAHLNGQMLLANAWPELLWQVTEQATGGALAAVGLMLHDEEMGSDLEHGA